MQKNMPAENIRLSCYGVSRLRFSTSGRTLVRNERHSHLQLGYGVSVPTTNTTPKTMLGPSVTYMAAYEGTYCARRAYTRRRKLTRSKYRRDTGFHAAYPYKMSNPAVKLTPEITSPKAICELECRQCSVRTERYAAYNVWLSRDRRNIVEDGGDTGDLNMYTQS